jgi:hypothetical protein
MFCGTSVSAPSVSSVVNSSLRASAPSASPRYLFPRSMEGAETTRPALAGGIGDFTEDGGLARAGGGGEIRWAAMEGFVGEDSEGEGLFGGFGDAEGGGGEDLDLGSSGHRANLGRSVLRR